MTMRTIPEGMRPYERLERCGAEALSDAELLAILIKSGTRERSALVIAEELLLKHGSLTDVGTAELSALKSCAGIGFYNAIKNLASAVVLAHNHPSGDCRPSRADYDTTERLVKAGRLVGIDVADHMIVGNGKYYSMYREGDLIKMKEKTLNEGSEDYGT